MDTKEQIDRELDKDFPIPKIRNQDIYGVMVKDPQPEYGFYDGEIIAVFNNRDVALQFAEAGIKRMPRMKLIVCGGSRWLTPGMRDSPEKQLPAAVMQAWRELGKKEYDLYHKAGLIGYEI